MKTIRLVPCDEALERNELFRRYLAKWRNAASPGAPLKSAFLATAIVLRIFGVCSAQPADGKTDYAKVSLPAGVVAPGSEATRAALVCFLEGPAVDADDNVFFSDIVSNR